MEAAVTIGLDLGKSIFQVPELISRERWWSSGD
jgi:hypothetical protein